MTEDETAISEITILPDGRLLVLGASQQVLGALEALCPDDPALRQRLERIRGAKPCVNAEVGGNVKILGSPTNAFREKCEP